MSKAESGTPEGNKYIKQPYFFDDIDYEQIRNLIKDNFPDMEQDTQVQLLDFIDAHFYWNK
jgi:hypothetical protein